MKELEDPLLSKSGDHSDPQCPHLWGRDDDSQCGPVERARLLKTMHGGDVLLL